MEDEIDLGKLFRIAIRQWKWIALLTVAAALAAFAVSSLAQPTYEAASLVIVARPRYLFQFDPRIQNLVQPQQPYKAYQDLALSDDVLRQLTDRLSGAATPANLADRLQVRSATDQSLLRLVATDADPQRAQTIANAWAEVYVKYVNTLSQPGPDEEGYFQEQAARKLEQLQAAEQAVIDFEQSSRILVLEKDIDSLTRSLSDYTAIGQGLSALAQDARNLRDRIAQRDADEPISSDEALAALILSANAYNARAGSSVQLQVNVDALGGSRTVGEQLASLDDVSDVLDQKLAAAQQQIAAIEQNILDLQKTQREAEVKHDQLLRERDAARDAWSALSRKQDEAQLAAMSSSGEVEIASQAALPAGPVSSRRGVNTVLGGMLGLALGVIVAWAVGMRRPAEA